MGNTISLTEIPEYNWINVAPIIPYSDISDIATSNYINLATLMSDMLTISIKNKNGYYISYIWIKSMERDYLRSINVIPQNTLISNIYSSDIAKFMLANKDQYYTKLGNCYEDKFLIKKYYPDYSGRGEVPLVQ